MNQHKTIRKASQADVNAIYHLTLPYVAEQVLLPRSKTQITANLDNTWVIQQENEIIAAVSLIFFRPHLCEIRGLAVKKEAHGNRYGQDIVKAVLRYLQNEYTIKPVQVFALTYVPDFFKKLGFTITKKEDFPDKVYEVCQFCARRDDCREIAVQKMIN